MIDLQEDAPAGDGGAAVRAGAEFGLPQHPFGLPLLGLIVVVPLRAGLGELGQLFFHQHHVAAQGSAEHGVVPGRHASIVKIPIAADCSHALLINQHFGPRRGAAA